MSSFGRVTRVHILNNHGKSNNYTAFVDYSTFAEAEKAIRLLHSSQNSGLGIKAEFANPRKSNPLESQVIQRQQPIIEEEVPSVQDLIKDLVTLDLNYTAPTNDNYEKVTQFEYQPNQPDKDDLKQLEDLKNLAKESKWEFEENSVMFNKKLMQSFLQFKCNQCNRTAMMRDDTTKKYFCSLKCFHNIDEQIEESELKQSDKVIITAIISEKCLFIRRSQDDLNQIRENVYRTVKNNLNGLQMMPNVDEEVIVEAFGQLHRAKILEIINDDGIDFFVQLIDVGNTIKVEFKVRKFKIKKIVIN